MKAMVRREALRFSRKDVDGIVAETILNEHEEFLLFLETCTGLLHELMFGLSVGPPCSEMQKFATQFSMLVSKSCKTCACFSFFDRRRNQTETLV